MVTVNLFQANDELVRLRGELAKGSKASRQTVAAQSILRRVEAERDEALNDLRRANTERDTLREKLKASANVMPLFKIKFMNKFIFERIEELLFLLKTNWKEPK